MAGTALKRLMAEYKQLTLNPPEGIVAGPMNEENFFEWEALIIPFANKRPFTGVLRTSIKELTVLPGPSAPAVLAEAAGFYSLGTGFAFYSPAFPEFLPQPGFAELCPPPTPGCTALLTPFPCPRRGHPIPSARPSGPCPRWP
ncbi:ubiquitin-conjugating enzyme E2 G2 isoform X3 [Rousettus aegyptiacus]|uniref:ubiquitin-conjugating enzyme E2 G2 isoform X3 n=1 Tax=Rousettus aegyptiacus TaxID=9407 RepID=UPI00168D64CB|nr:ubiquitin-conjugating enzyme E2 G2 isoform X3 [Rousettus aegyptiacus]